MKSRPKFKKHLGIPKEVSDWMDQIVEINWQKTKSESIREKISHKVAHTDKVVEEMEALVRREINFDWDINTAKMVALVHDVGRFPQALKDSFSDVETGIDHGDLGAKLYKNKGFKLDNFDDEEIEASIKWHNKIKYSGNNIYVKAIRDADKIVILKEQYSITHGGRSGAEISQKVWQAVMANKLVDKRDVVSLADWILLQIMIMWDMNFPSSKEKIHNSGIPEWLMNKLEEVGVDKIKEELIRQKISDY